MLIDLFVLIAIIALLSAILTPVLNRVKKHAKSVACQTNLRQWGAIFQTYTNDNNGYFCGRGKIHDARVAWIVPLRPYLQAETNLLFCPEATKPHPDGCAWGGPFNTYHIHLLAYMMGQRGTADWQEEASYGANSWIYNPQPDVGNLQGRPTEWNWKSTNVKDAENIPVFADTMWRGGGPYHDGVRGNPPPNDGQWVRYDREMMHFCINRHNRAVNHLFMDWSVRKVGLKELWTLKWHREFDTAGPWTTAGGVLPGDWPQWMGSFKDY